VRLAALSPAALALTLTFAGAATSSQPVSGLHGVVMMGPTMPVCKVNVPCEKPAAGIVLRFARAGSTAARVKTTQSGKYSVRLRPGAYAVSTVPQRPVGRGLTPRIVRVPRGRVARRDFRLDTGIQ
jgi:hypothetical protein